MAVVSSINGFSIVTPVEQMLLDVRSGSYYRTANDTAANTENTESTQYSPLTTTDTEAVKQSDIEKSNGTQTQNNQSDKLEIGSKKEDEDKEEEPAAVVNKELTEDEEKVVEELKETDKKVRSHENAHKAAGGSLVRGASYSTTTGPDNKEYVTGGEVKIDMSAVNGDPEATIRKMQQVRRAALAPSDPSAQDRMVAQKASSIEAEARAELNNKILNTDSGSKRKTIDYTMIYKTIIAGEESAKGSYFDMTNKYSVSETLKNFFISKPAYA
jgi:hypothetical protein